MNERELSEGGSKSFTDRQQDMAWEERVKEDIIWEGGLQSQFLPQRVEPERTEDFKTFHPDLTKHWD